MASFSSVGSASFSSDADKIAYHEVRLHSPQGIDEVEERLRSKLEPNGITLTSDIMRALAFAIVNGRNL